MRKRRVIAALLALIIAIGLAGGLYAQKARRKASQAAGAAMQRTVVVQRRTVSESIDAAGDLQALRQESLYAKVSGKVVEVLVKPGDIVKAGQTLVRLHSDEAVAAVEDAKDNLALAKNSLSNAQNTFAKAPQSAEIALQKARQEYLNAKLRVEQLEAGPKLEEVEQQKAAVRQAQLNLQTAQNELSIQEALYQAKAIPRAEYEQYLNAVAIARDNAANAQLKLDALLRGSDQKEKHAAASALRQAEINLRIAEEEAQQAASRAAIIEAEVAVRNAEKALRVAQENLDSLTIKAPFAGMILAVNAVVGQEKPAGSADNAIVTMSSHDRWQVMAYVDEADLSSLHIGQRANVMLTAMEERSFTGRLTAIGGTARNSQGVVTYPIYIELDAYNPIFRPGMSADVLVQLVHRPNVLAVPDAAIVQRQGRHMVLLPGQGENAEPNYVEVEVGESGGGYTEIISGLTEGQTIVLPSRSGRQPAGQAPNSGQRPANVMFMMPR